MPEERPHWYLCDVCGREGYCTAPDGNCLMPYALLGMGYSACPGKMTIRMRAADRHDAEKPITVDAKKG